LLGIAKDVGESASNELAAAAVLIKLLRFKVIAASAFEIL
jgi:hypothetical protein